MTKNNPLTVFISALFLIWFFGSVAAMIYFSKSESKDLCVAVFGQLFLIFGLVGIVSSIKNKNFHAFILLFPLIGAGSLFFSLTYHFMPDKRESIMDMLPYAMLALFFVVGLGVFLYGIINRILLTKKCTYSIYGKVVSVRSRYDDGTKMYCPTYEIYYRGESIQLCDNVYSNISVKNEGESVEMLIDPDEPTRFYIPSQNKFVSNFLIIFGLLFMAVPLIALFGMYMQNKTGG